MDYIYKIEIELDDDKIIAERKYRIDDIYRAIQEMFAEQDIQQIKTAGHMLVFVTQKKNNYANIWAGTNAVYFSDIKPYFKSITWYNREYGDKYCEDVIAAFEEEGL